MPDLLLLRQVKMQDRNHRSDRRPWETEWIKTRQEEEV